MTPDEAALLSKRIDEAKATLLDPDARTRYDEALRSGETVAAAGSANGAFSSLAPAIPAAQPVSPAAHAAEGGPPAELATPRPAILLARAVAAAGEAPGGPGEPPAGKPILLQREVPPLRTPEAPAAGPPPPEALPVPDGPAWTGDALRQVREARGITIQQIAERTKVTRHHIENIEGERFGALPAPVYLRGILLSVARELRLDGQKVARAYLERVVAALAAKK